MRVLRASFIALLTAFVGCLLAFFVGDFLTRLAHMSNMEGGRGMFVVFVCAPLGILVGLVIGIVSSFLVRRQGLVGFFVAQGWSLLIVCGLAVCWLAFHICYRTNLRGSMESAWSCNSSFAPPQRLRSQTSPTVTVSGLAFIRTIGKISTLSLTGTRSQKVPNMSRFPDMSRC